MFVLDPSGQGLLLMGSTKALATANWWSIGRSHADRGRRHRRACRRLPGWALIKTNLLERWMLIIAGFALVYPATIADLIGFGLVIAALALQLLRRSTRLRLPELGPYLGMRNLSTDILILGSGGAGLFAALHAHQADPTLDITVAVKGLLGKCGCTRMVQAATTSRSRRRFGGAPLHGHIEGGKWLPTRISRGSW